MSIGPTIARKRHVQVEQAAILAWLDEQHAATLRDRRAQCHRRKADGFVAQGKLTVVVGSRIEKDGAATPRRYRSNHDDQGPQRSSGVAQALGSWVAAR